MNKERSFYACAYADNSTRRERGYGWEFEPSKVVADLFEKHIGYNNSIRVLDVGCGDGRHIEYFACRSHETGQVVGIDFSPEAVRFCRKRFDFYSGQYFSNLIIEPVDMTKKDALKHFGQFDLIVDWSVMDHIRRKYLEHFKKNILDALKTSGHLISAQLSPPFPNHLPLKGGKDYRLKNGHYTKAYTAQDLQVAFPSLRVVETRRALEDEKNGFWVETVLFKKT